MYSVNIGVKTPVFVTGITIDETITPSSFLSLVGTIAEDEQWEAIEVLANLSSSGVIDLNATFDNASFDQGTTISTFVSGPGNVTFYDGNFPSNSFIASDGSKVTLKNYNNEWYVN